MTEGEILKEVFKSKRVKIRPLSIKLKMSRSTIHNDLKEILIIPEHISRYEEAIGFNWEQEKVRILSKSKQYVNTNDTFLFEESTAVPYNKPDLGIQEISAIERLVSLRNKGDITEEDYQILKSKIINK